MMAESKISTDSSGDEEEASTNCSEDDDEDSRSRSGDGGQVSHSNVKYCVLSNSVMVVFSSTESTYM